MIGKTIRHYEILEELGRGGMGVVYKALDLKLDRHVALKFLPSNLGQDEIDKRRFIQEAKSASALDHPNICTIHEVDETEDGQLFIVMAYYEGETLKQKVARRPLSVAQAVDAAIQLASGLAKAHEKGIIHRDIKPANIVLTDDGVVKILDFGIAKLVGESRLTQDGMALGTITYMSPEQLKGKELDHRSDIWSFGVVLYEALTGRPPFSAEIAQVMLYAITNEEPDFSPLSRADVPETLGHIVQKCLQKEPGERFQSCNEIATELVVGSGSAGEAHAFPRAPSNFYRILRESVWGRVVAPAVLAVVLLGWILLRFLPRDSLPLNPSDYVVVADFQNFTENPVFDHSVTEAIKVSLRQSASFNVLPPRRIADALSLLQLSSDHPVDSETALRIARREGARAVVIGEIARLGEQYVLSCRVIDASSKETVRSMRREVGEIESVLGAMDELSEDVRESLGESLAEISHNSMPLEKVTTPSIEALELYSQGNTLQGLGKYEEAAVLVQRAVDKDSAFAMAISDLSYIYRKIGNDSLALEYHYKVLPLLDRVTDRERYLILATYYGLSFELDFRKAFTNLQRYVVLYPNDSEGFAYLGHLAAFAGDFTTAFEANKKALEIDSTYRGTIYNNTGFAHALAGDADEAISYFKKSKSIRPDYYATDMYIAQAYLMHQEPDSAEQLLRSIPEAAGPRLSLRVHMQLAALYHLLGRLQDSQNECQVAVSFCQAMTLPADEAYFHYLLAELARERADDITYRTEAGLAAKLGGSPFFEYALVGMSYARSGDLEHAQGIISKIERARSLDPYFLKRKDDFVHFIQAEMALAEGRLEEAEDGFAAVQKIHSGDPLYLMAQAGTARCRSMADPESAVGIYEDILDRRGEVAMAFVSSIRNSGFWIRWLWPDVHLELGKLYLRLKRLPEARRHLMSALSLWENADGVFGNKVVAQELLSKIRSEN